MTQLEGQGKSLKKQQKLEKQEKEVKDKVVGKAQATQLQQFSYDHETADGDLKNVSGAWPPAYNPEFIEKSWYSYWKSHGYFTPKNLDNPHKFTMMIPPPNITGQLHIGHALTNAIQDALARYYRMSGYCVEWLPGLDHAGISCQVVVEKMLKKQHNKSRYDYGREAFVQEIWNYKNDYGNRILNQLEKLGSSLDWSRQIFTLDEQRVKAHNAAFKRFFDDGLIYRDNRLVSWDCTLQTAISDVEVEYLQVDSPIQMEIRGKKYPFGYLWKFAYPVLMSDELANLSDQELAAYYDANPAELTKNLLYFATTRPETMIGDTAIAIHPDDERYAQFHGKSVYHPIRRCKIPIVCDSIIVDMNFGTGSVKLTPSHDPNDFEAGKRHNLPTVNMLRDDGTCYAPGTIFDKVPRFDARIEVIKFFTGLGLYFNKEPNKMALGLSQRTHEPVEPLLKPQWYLNCEQMAKMAVDAVDSSQLLIVPSSHIQTWHSYLDNIRPWCISRQLWWGHQIPLYKVWKKDEEEPSGMSRDDYVFAECDADALAAATRKLQLGSDDINVQRDPDVTDTWFSSALFPFSALGWPEKTPDFDAFFPGSVLETGHDILFFWVARMVMVSLYLTGKLPFTEVYLHSMVRDSRGEKMSKSKGNVIDPLDCICGISREGLLSKLKEGNLSAKELESATALLQAEFPSGIAVCGTDALRMALCLFAGQGRSINLDVNKIVAQRNFCNKVFNAVKFAIECCGVDTAVSGTYCSSEGFLQSLQGQPGQQREQLNIQQQYILFRLAETVYAVNKAFRMYNISDAAQAILTFQWEEFCDKFVELVKGNVTPLNKLILLACIDTTLKLLHPIMPFLTEEMYQHLPRWAGEAETDTIMKASYPRDCKWFTFGATEEYAKYDELCVDRESVFTAMREQYSGSVAIFSKAMEIVRQIRIIKQQYKLAPGQKLQAYACGHIEPQAIDIVCNLAGLESLEQRDKDFSEECCGCQIIDNDLKILINLKGLVDFGREKQAKEKEAKEVTEQIQRLQKLMDGPNYAKMPEQLRSKNDARMAELRQKERTLQQLIEEYGRLM